MNGHDAHFLILFSIIGFALIVKFFFVRRLTTLSLGKCVLADFVMNLVSVLVGIILISVALFLLQVSIGTLLDNYLNIGKFNLGAAIAPFVTRTTIFLVAIVVLAWLETMTLRVIFNQGDFGQESHWKFFRQLCVANAAVVAFAFGILSVHNNSPNVKNVKYASFDDNVGITLQVDGTQIILPAGWRKIDFPTNLYVQQGAANPKKRIAIIAGVTKSDQSVEQFADIQFADTSSAKLKEEVLSRKNMEISGFPTVEIDGKRTNQQSGKQEFIRSFIFAGSDPQEIVTISYVSPSEDIFQDQSLVDFIQRPAKAN
jgi:hypothetical protein